MQKTFLALAFAYQSVAYAGPVESVTALTGKLMSILSGVNEQQKITDLCTLVQSDLDNETIASTLLGPYEDLATDAAGVADFKKSVASVIMDQFYGLLQDKGGAPFMIGGTVPKGSGKTGVKITIGSANFVVTVLRANDKVVDVEWNNFSIVNLKRDEFQRELRDLRSDKPVSALEARLNNQGVNKCR